MYVDFSGYDATAAAEWGKSMWWVTLADGSLPCGEIIYVGVLVLLSVSTGSYESSTTISYNVEHFTPQIVFDDDIHVVEPSPDAEEPDAVARPDFPEDDYDDYYDDEDNFGGRERIGKSKGNTPRNNQRQNKQFEDATKGLDKAQRRRIHDMITNNGLDFEDILEIIDTIFG